MLNEAEMQIICNTLYIIINFKKFRNYIKEKDNYLYSRIYKPYEKTEILSKEKIKEIIKKNNLEIIVEIKKYQDELSKTEQKGIIGTFDNYIKMMIIHYNEIHTETHEVQEVELWRPKTKNKEY